MSGSKNMLTHRQFLDARYNGMHFRNAEFQPLKDQASWKTLLAMFKQLESSNPKVSYLDLNDRQMR